ncbi:sialidase family protein [Coraliomargarita akajimensis]|uniref:Sortilin N-terminal domain-containing protein n=1 Tax=Coraliomargarita akajimensis (strain DSM 45221 / IAM 15411 / JCM 23193 / KCTC 12865 / 04OKA010-24) TaxID=583355 RepID=D5EN85_CORAD|nr:sialidase family protein [Coraliomargarita akajimensis]ADE53520.1 hypothetical protein Caka_0495 [Coraliomargarita akajimensis DSM 45221]
MRPRPSALLTALITTTCLTTQAVVVWEADFEDQALNTSAGTNANLGTTQIQTANALTGTVVSAPGGLSHMSGNALLLSTSGNGWEAIRPASHLTPIDLTAYGIDSGQSYRLSFDLYIPNALSKAVGDVQFRWNNLSDSTINAHATLAAGEHHIEVTGSFPVAVGIPESFRPFIGFDQSGSAANEFVYIDNLKFEILPTPPPPPSPSWTFADLQSTEQASHALIQWQHFGPGMSGYIDKFWINNGDPDAMYTQLDMGNGHLTLNRGEYWTSYKSIDGTGNDYQGVTWIEFSHQDPDFGIMIAKNDFYQTTDRGRTWQHLIDEDSSGSAKHNVLAVDPSNDSNWYIGAGQGWMIKFTHYTMNGIIETADRNHSEGFVMYSKDKGQSWTRVYSPFPADACFSRIIVDPRNSNHVYASCQYGVYQSTDGGLSWSLTAGTGLPHHQPRDMASFYDEATGDFYLYVVLLTHYTPNGTTIDTTGGVYRSSDGGSTWSNLTGDLAIDFTQITSYNPGWDYHQRFYRAIAFWLEISETQAESLYPDLPTSTFSQFHQIAVDPTNKDRIYLVHNYKHDYSFPPGNIWMTENGGTNWYAAAREGLYWKNETDKAYWQSRAVQPLGINTSFAHVEREHNEGNHLQSGPRFIVCNQEGEVYTAFAQQILRTTDNGATWQQIDDDETAAANGHWVGRGNSNLPGETFCLDTRTPGIYLWGSGEHGLWRNTDDGDLVYPKAIAVEQLTGQSHEGYGTLSLSSIAIHPDDNNQIYTLQFRQGNRGHLRHSSDNGASWTSINADVCGFSAFDANAGIRQRSLLIDYDTPDNMYFCVPYSEWVGWATGHWYLNGPSGNTGFGVYRSNDGGANFSLAMNGIPAASSVFCLAMDPSDPQIIYAALNETHDFDPGGLYKTTDGGSTWNAVSLPAGIVSVNEVAIHEDSGAIYIACGSFFDSGHTGGAYVSNDGGASWTLIFDMPHVRNIAPSPANPDVIAVIVGQAQSIGSINPGAYVTIDGAQSWHKINRDIGHPNFLRKIGADPYNEDILWLAVGSTGFFRADIRALRTGVEKPFFWDWMLTHDLTEISADPDRDGIDTRTEFLAGTDPTDANSYFRSGIQPDPVNGHQILFDSALARNYEIHYSDDLINWHLFDTDIQGTGAQIQVQDAEGQPKRFYRIEATLD